MDSADTTHCTTFDGLRSRTSSTHGLRDCVTKRKLASSLAFYFVLVWYSEREAHHTEPSHTRLFPPPQIENQEQTDFCFTPSNQSTTTNQLSLSPPEPPLTHGRQGPLARDDGYGTGSRSIEKNLTQPETGPIPEEESLDDDEGACERKNGEIEEVGNFWRDGGPLLD